VLREATLCFNHLYQAVTVGFSSWVTHSSMPHTLELNAPTYSSERVSFLPHTYTPVPAVISASNHSSVNGDNRVEHHLPGKEPLHEWESDHRYGKKWRQVSFLVNMLDVLRDQTTTVSRLQQFLTCMVSRFGVGHELLDRCTDPYQR